MAEELADWVFDSVLQFLKSPLWTVPVDTWVEEHCGKFIIEEEENKLEYTQLHNEFRQLIDDLLSGFLEELCVDGEKFIEAIKTGSNKELSDRISEFIYALDDYPSFRALMEKRNVQMELELLQRAGYFPMGVNPLLTEEDAIAEQERVMLEAAIQMSLQADLVQKQMEHEDAELLQALAMSIAMEQERLLYEQLQYEADEKAQQELEDESRKMIEELQAQTRQARLANVERVVQELEKEKIETPPAAAAEPPRATPPPPPPPPPSSDGPKSSSAQALLAPIQERRTRTFGAKSLLPGIANKPLPPISTAPQPPPVVSPTTQPALKDLRKEVEEQRAVQPRPELSKEELDKRAAYFREQREKLREMKKKEREAQLAEYKQQMTGSPVVEPQPAGTAQPAQQGDADAKAKEEEREMRRALARRFKEDLIHEVTRVQEQQ